MANTLSKSSKAACTYGPVQLASVRDVDAARKLAGQAKEKSPKVSADGGGRR
jgi:hypothetical protein